MGTLVTFMVITSVLLLGYIIDGVEVIQDNILEMIWTLLGFFMFMATGILTIMTWSDTDSTSSNASELEYTRNSRAAMGLGALCIINSLVYMVDFTAVLVRRRRYQPVSDGL